MSLFPFVSGSFNGRSPSFDAQRTVNLYLEQSESQTSRTQAMLIGTPGLKLWTALGGGRIKGMFVFNPATAIVVSGTTVYKLTTTGVSSVIGTIAATSDTIVSMTSNGTLIMLVMGAFGYFIDPNANTVTPIGDPDFAGGNCVDFCDGYFVWNKPNTGQFQISQLYGTGIDGLDFATAEGSPDNIISLIVDHREVWLFGVNTTQVFVNTGNPDFPFEAIQGAFLEVGCAATYSVAKLDNSLLWLANDERGYGTVQRANGYNPVRVSNHAVEFAINGYPTIADAVAYTYTQEGHPFYVLNFPAANATWAYDGSTQLWHERAYLDPATGTMGRHRSNCQMSFAGVTLVGDWQNGNIYELDLDTYSDNGDPLRSIRVTPHVAGDGKQALHTALQVLMQTGVGLQVGQGSNPQAMLKWSDDGGYTWSNEHWTSVGAIGATLARARWLRLGTTRDRIYWWEMTDPVKRVIVGANLETVQGKS